MVHDGDCRLAEDAMQGSCFNSRPREGATFEFALNGIGGKVSIHAPVRRRPVAGGVVELLCLVSIHAPVRGRRRNCIKLKQN